MTCYKDQGLSQEFAVRGTDGVWGTEVPSGVQGQRPGEGQGAKPPEAREKC